MPGSGGTLRDACRAMPRHPSILSSASGASRLGSAAQTRGTASSASRHTLRSASSMRRRSIVCRGPLRHSAGAILPALLIGSLALAAPTRAQDAGAAEGAADAAVEPLDAGVPEPPSPTEASDAPPDAPVEDGAPTSAASALGAPSPPPVARAVWRDDEVPPAFAGPPRSSVAGAPATLETSGAAPAPGRPRYWRMPRANVARPLTLPQGVLLFESVLSFAVFGNATMTGIFSTAAGLHDDVEIGATPVAITFAPGLQYNDPMIYARVRALSGEVQLAFRGHVVIPASRLEAQAGVAAELAWLASDVFRLDASVDYGLLFSDPLHQRVGAAIRPMLQAGPNAFALTLGCYVFNDADDVDVPLLLRYTATFFGGWQGPLTEASLEGGFLDLAADDVGRAWMFRASMTFFAYL